MHDLFNCLCQLSLGDTRVYCGLANDTLPSGRCMPRSLGLAMICLLPAEISICTVLTAVGPLTVRRYYRQIYMHQKKVQSAVKQNACVSRYRQLRNVLLRLTCDSSVRERDNCSMCVGNHCHTSHTLLQQIVALPQMKSIHHCNLNKCE